MSLFQTAFKLCVAAVGLAAGLAVPAASAEFAARRGVNLDQWVTWPKAESWGEPGVLQPFPEWRKSVFGDDLLKLRKAGFDFVRVPVDPAPFMSPQTIAIRDQLYADVRDAARLINAAGLKAVIDLHLIPGSDGRVGMEAVMREPERFDEYLGVVRQMAQTLAREPADKVALELMNEPSAECEAAGAGSWRDRQIKLFAAARASATRLTLVLTGGCGSNAQSLTAVNPVDYPDDNLLWTFHSYDPPMFTHQGATWAGDFYRYVSGLPFPPLASSPELETALDQIRARIKAEAPVTRKAGMLSYLDEQVAEVDTPGKLDAVMNRPFQQVSEWADRHGVKRETILRGEFGMIAQEYGSAYIVPAKTRANYYKAMIERAEEAGFIVMDMVRGLKPQ